MREVGAASEAVNRTPATAFEPEVAQHGAAELHWFLPRVLEDDSGSHAQGEEGNDIGNVQGAVSIGAVQFHLQSKLRDIKPCPNFIGFREKCSPQLKHFERVKKTLNV